MKFWERFKSVFSKAIGSNVTPKQIAMSFCIGIYIAFSPFPGLHAVMMIFFKWFFNLNFPVLFIATSINNPWTMVPFYSFDYAFGYWIVHELFNCNPSMVISLVKVFGYGKICLWSFLIGGNVLGLMAAIICYPFVFYFLKSYKTV